MKKNNSGFTLVEGAVVLVVVAMMIGGVVGVRKMMDSSKRSTIIAELSAYNKATADFRVKYNALPGDLSLARADQFFDGNAANFSTCAAGLVFGDSQWGSDTEHNLVFVQLSASELISKDIDFNVCDNPAPVSPGVHRPVSDAISGAAYTYLNTEVLSIARNNNIGAPGTTRTFSKVLRLGSPSNNTDKRLSTGGLAVDMVRAIDLTIDDGEATAGKFFTSGNCLNRDVATGLPPYLEEGSNVFCTANLSDGSSDSSVAALPTSSSSGSTGGGSSSGSSSSSSSSGSTGGSSSSGSEPCPEPNFTLGNTGSGSAGAAQAQQGAVAPAGGN